jgi:hypothetical protein
MAGNPTAFKRLVLGLEPSAPDRAMRLAVELAELLHLELLGLFLEDPSLRNLAAFPFAREFRPLGGGWRAIDLEALTRDLDIAVRTAERLFVEAAKDLTTGCEFEVIREAGAQALSSISRSGDIVMITEPSTPFARATQPFAWLLDAAFQSDAAVMVVPAKVARVAGPVVAIAVTPDDPSIRAAAAVATAAKEVLVVVHAHEGRDDDPGVRKLTAETGLTIKHAFIEKGRLSDPVVYGQALLHVQERLVVMTRRVLTPTLALAIASSRCVPILVIAPGDDTQQSQ